MWYKKVRKIPGTVAARCEIQARTSPPTNRKPHA